MKSLLEKFDCEVECQRVEVATEDSGDAEGGPQGLVKTTQVGTGLVKLLTFAFHLYYYHYVRAHIHILIITLGNILHAYRLQR